MKLSKQEIGARGEAIAYDYLIKQGYTVVARNWRYSRAEIDLIAKDGAVLVFVEVKTRSYTYYGEPSDSVTEHKEAMVMDAAQRYMESIDYDWEIRFDIISIILRKSGDCEKIEHFKDAFFN